MRTSLSDAIYKTIHEYSDGQNKGPAALGPKINISAGYLNNKADDAMPSHKLGLEESIPVQREANDYRIVHAYCMELNGVFVQIKQMDFVSDSALVDIWARLDEKAGEFAKVHREALDDGYIDHQEMKDIRETAQQRISVLLELVKRLESIHHQSVNKK